jgi:hypothetical protein
MLNAWAHKQDGFRPALCATSKYNTGGVQDVRIGGNATIIINNSKEEVKPENTGKKGSPKIGDIIDYNIGSVESPGMRIENFIQGCLGAHMYNFSIAKRVDAKFQLCDVTRPVTLILLTDGGDYIDKAQTGNPRVCSDINTPLSPGTYSLEV